MDFAEDSVRVSYDAVADNYSKAMLDELERKPLDRAFVDGFAALCQPRGAVLSGAGPILDVGCGPGHTLRHLRAGGFSVRGIDLSPAMVDIARRHARGVEVDVGSILRLPYPDNAFSGVLSLYSIIHLAPALVPAAVSELHRVLAPGGRLVLAFHTGDRVIHVDEMFERAVDLDGYLFDPGHIVEAVTAAGLEIEARLDRRPAPEIEVATDRTYLLARRPVALPQEP